MNDIIAKKERNESTKIQLNSWNFFYFIFFHFRFQTEFHISQAERVSYENIFHFFVGILSFLRNDDTQSNDNAKTIKW